MKLILILCLLNMVVSCTGTGADSQNGSRLDTAAPSVKNWDVYYIEAIADLPDCIPEIQGRLYYVAVQDGFQVCTSSGWVEVELRGADGRDGVKGADGPEGSPGVDGVSALISVSEEAPGVNCAAGGVRVDVGIDQNRDSVLEPTEVDSTEYICNGVDGSRGADGVSALISVIEEAPGGNCVAGGVRVDAGIDDNGDNVLSPTEVDSTEYICNGSQGAGGATGSSGDDGTSCSVTVTDCVATLTCDDETSASWGGACEVGEPCSLSSDCVSALCSDEFVCIEPCLNQSTRMVPCGLNLEGTVEEDCVAGLWVESGVCSGSDLCVLGNERVVVCGFNDEGERSESCVDGEWSSVTDCSGTDVCRNESVDSRLCGINNRGQSIRTCSSGQWGSFEPCVDPDVCIDGSEEIGACGFNGLGSWVRTCSAGVWGGYGVCIGACTNVVCDDGNPCTLNYCDSALGCLSYVSPGTACSDGNKCTLSDRCTSGGKCTGTSIKSCSDGNKCTVDSCDRDSGNCVFTEDLEIEGCSNSDGGYPRCKDTCTWPDDGRCDDGSEGSYSSACSCGTDCSDCGVSICPN